ncbi:unnamed protein product, partial [Tetraodon nigroviridis]
VLAVFLTFFSLAESKDKDFYTFKVVNSRGKLVSLEKYRGSVSLVVNVASECGFTEEHYKDLQQLQRDFGPYHFNVLAFPLQPKSSGKEPDWNFWKYLVDVNGRVVDAWGPKVSVKEVRPKIAELVRQIILKKKEEL